MTRRPRAHSSQEQPSRVRASVRLDPVFAWLAGLHRATGPDSSLGIDAHSPLPCMRERQTGAGAHQRSFHEQSAFIRRHNLHWLQAV